MYLNLGANISRNKKLQEENNFCETIKNICELIKLRCVRQLSLEIKITIFKSLAISNIVHLALLTLNLNNVFEDLKQIQKTLFWENKTAKVKNMHMHGMHGNGLHNVDISDKIAVLKFLGYEDFMIRNYMNGN